MSPSGIRAAALVGTALGWTLSGRASLDGEKAAPGKYSRCIEYPWDGLPEPHAHRTNPLTGADAATEAGVGPYRDHCAVCHGVSGKGGRPGRRLPEPTAGEPGLHARHAGPHRPVSLLDDLRRGWASGHGDAGVRRHASGARDLADRALCAGGIPTADGGDAIGVAPPGTVSTITPCDTPGNGLVYTI